MYTGDEHIRPNVWVGIIILLFEKSTSEEGVDNILQRLRDNFPVKNIIVVGNSGKSFIIEIGVNPGCSTQDEQDQLVIDFLKSFSCVRIAEQQSFEYSRKET